MSSTNNAAPDDTVINIENDATIPIPNQNQSTAAQGNRQASSTADNPEPVPTLLEKLISFFASLDDDYDDSLASFIFAYLQLMVMSLFVGTYNIFPILLPISLCSLSMAIYGDLREKYNFLIPFMLTVAWDTIYGIICVIFYITFYASDKEFFLNKALYFCWEEKAEIFEKIGDHWESFVLHLICTVFQILGGIGIIFATKFRYTELQKKYVEEIRRVAVERFRESLQQNGLIIVCNEHRLQSAAQDLSNEQTNSNDSTAAISS